MESSPPSIERRIPSNVKGNAELVFFTSFSHFSLSFSCFRFPFSFLLPPSHSHPLYILPYSVPTRWHTRSHRRKPCVPPDRHHLQDQASDHPIHSNSHKDTRDRQGNHTQDNNREEDNSLHLGQLLIQVNSRLTTDPWVPEATDPDPYNNREERHRHDQCSTIRIPTILNSNKITMQ